MEKLEIECKGIGNLSLGKKDYVAIELEEVDMSFLEQVSAADIIKGCDLNELLNAIDYEVLMYHLEEKYDIEKIKVMG